MPEINRISGLDASKTINEVNIKDNAKQIGSEDSLSSLSGNVAVSKQGKDLAAQTLLLNESELTPKYIEQMVNEAESEVVNIKRFFSLLVQQLDKNTGDDSPEEQLKQLVDLIPKDVGQLLESLEAQHSNATAFCGKFFNTLNQLLQEYDSNELIKESILQLLKNYDFHINAKASAESIIVNMEKLSKSTILKSQGKPIQEALAAFKNEYPLSEELSSQQITKMLGTLKSNVIPQLKEALIDNKTNFFARAFLMTIIQNTVKLENSSEETLFSSLEQLFLVLNGYETVSEPFKQELKEALKESIKLNSQNPKDKFMNKMLDILSNKVEKKPLDASYISASNVLDSLVANQSSTFSLLHFILPFYNQTNVAFAQIWVDPDAQKKQNSDPNSKTKHGKQIFCRINVELIGNFDLILFVDDDSRIDCKLLCPKHVAASFDTIKPQISSIIKNGGFKVENLEVAANNKEVKLNEIFPQINNRRRLVNVKI